MSSSSTKSLNRWDGNECDCRKDVILQCIVCTNNVQSALRIVAVGAGVNTSSNMLIIRPERTINVGLRSASQFSFYIIIWDCWQHDDPNGPFGSNIIGSASLLPIYILLMPHHSNHIQTNIHHLCPRLKNIASASPSGLVSTVSHGGQLASSSHKSSG